MNIITCLLCFLATSFHAQISVGSQDSHIISKIELNDSRLVAGLTDYIAEDDLNGVEGAVVLKYDKGNPDTFYVGYIVYKSGLLNDPPTHYTFVKNKLVLIYTGLERYVKYNDKSFKTILKDAKGSFLEGQVIVEPTYWELILLDKNYQKKAIDRLPY